MIYIERGATNSIALELSGLEGVECDSNFLFQFDNEFDIDIDYIYFTTDDISLNKNRYNLFLLEESISGSPTTASGTSSLLLNPSQYKYNIYATSSIIDINDINLLVTTDVVSDGRMKVK